MAHPLLGKQVKFRGAKGPVIDAFVVAIDDNIGMTIHVLDREEADRKGVLHRDGEVVCVDLSEYYLAFPGTTREHYERFKMMVEDGFVDYFSYREKFRDPCVGRSQMASCAFK